MMVERNDRIPQSLHDSVFHADTSDRPQRHSEITLETVDLGDKRLPPPLVEKSEGGWQFTALGHE
jgi:hypothetical protein